MHIHVRALKKFVLVAATIKESLCCGSDKIYVMSYLVSIAKVTIRIDCNGNI
jgi:hypothetical protein